MKIFILNSNIIWSTAYNAKSDIGQFVLSISPVEVQFYAPEFLKSEIERHFPKIVKLSGQTEEEVRVVIELAYEKIKFISDDQIPLEFYQKSVPFVRGVDMDDLVFVALAEYMDELLWTGDLKLIAGLRSRGYQNVVDFSQVKELLV
jgi:predicted nucleic acid-binding protein